MSMASRRHIAVDAPRAFADILQVETSFGTEASPREFRYLDGPFVKGLCLDEEEFLVSRAPVSVGDIYALREELFHAYF
eukprot:CAMPEP_0194489796 /NCGR_PEP_ID=MMETSP0253-20130528/9220_1 /TAXON_ID=2966 /ORGANISM="Noctiluca scintillans" /LENGTH=78 /DNA_ID=CAMNT_0039330325 /DNA_START=144 /DNA_END=380 /DNA_ORIENTATION=+